MKPERPEQAAPEAATQPRIGLFFCRCGPNIGEVVRLGKLASQRWPGVAHVLEAGVLCSAEGKALLAREIHEAGVERVVLVGCSPREHEATFRGVLAQAGLEPFHLQMVNVREQGEWIGGPPHEATARARSLTRAAIRRVAHHRPIALTEVEVSPDAVVVGGGVAGMRAALTLAQKGRRVTLVEREFFLGGLVNTLGDVFPGMECASCFLSPVLDQVLHHPRIEVLAGAEVVDLLGSVGNFTVKVRQRPRRVDPLACLGCPRCSAACPVEVADPLGAGFGRRKAIGVPAPGCLPNVAALDEAACLRTSGQACTACAEACPFGAVRLDEAPTERAVRCGAVVLATGLSPPQPSGPPGLIGTYALERLLHPNGPTDGRPRRPDGREPRSVLLAPTAEALEADATLWAGEIAKLARQLRRALPGAAVAVAGPFAGRAAREVREAGVSILPGALDLARVVADGDGLSVHLEGGPEVHAELVVVHAPSLPAPGAEALARTLRLGVRPDGFLEDRTEIFEPAATRIAGVFVAGAAGGARTSASAIRDGAAAAGKVLSALVPGERMVLEPLASRVDPARCGGCGLCPSVCPFGAIVFDAEAGASRIEPSHCRACGTCAAACPARAIDAPHFTPLQIAEEIRGLLETDDSQGESAP